MVLSSSLDFDVPAIGKLLLESEWKSDKRPKETKINRQVYGSYVGQYQLSADFALGMLLLRILLFNVYKKVIGIPAGFCLAAMLVLVWRAAHPWIMLGSAVLSVVFWRL